MSGEKGAPPPPLHAPRVPRGTPEEGLAALAPLRLQGWDGRPPRWPSEVRLWHDGECLGARFRCAFDRLNVDPGLPRDRPSPRLWERDVVEVFVSAGPGGLPYREVEASPLGQWLALAFVAPRVPSSTPWQPTPRVTAVVDAARGEFEVAVALRLDDLADGPSGPREWRLGLFRIHGEEPDREYQSLVPAALPAPDFHRPGSWLPLVLE